MNDVELTSAEIDRRLRRVAQLNRLCKSLKQAGASQKVKKDGVGPEGAASPDAARPERFNYSLTYSWGSADLWRLTEFGSAWFFGT